jgi:hypothetical protein
MIERDKALEQFDDGLRALMRLTKDSFPLFHPDRLAEVRGALYKAKEALAQLRKDPYVAVSPTSGRSDTGEVQVFGISPPVRKGRGQPRKLWKNTAEEGLRRIGVPREPRRMLLDLVERRAKLGLNLPLSIKEESLPSRRRPARSRR